MKVYRQGDVWIYEISEEQFKKIAGRVLSRTPQGDKGLILAEGEVTGHHHRIPEGGVLYGSVVGSSRYLQVLTKPVQLVHEEHSTIELPPGHYEVRIQREYEPQKGSRRVTD